MDYVELLIIVVLIVILVIYLKRSFVDRENNVLETTVTGKLEIGHLSYDIGSRLAEEGDIEIAEKLLEYADKVYRSIETDPRADKYEREFTKLMREYMQKHYLRNVKNSKNNQEV